MSKSAMLRTRRRDVNVKPNRRLDRKSSRGMIYENEELRLRTININAEIERGQSDIKKLRRENEQLRKEIWCLRDEYDKLDKLLKEKDNSSCTSCSSNTDSCTSCSESEETETTQNLENVHKTTLNNLRSDFDHLSVVTEETSTENSDKNSQKSIVASPQWEALPPDMGYPNLGFVQPRLTTSKIALNNLKTIPQFNKTIDIEEPTIINNTLPQQPPKQPPKHFFAPLKTSKSFENCSNPENINLSKSWSNLTTQTSNIYTPWSCLTTTTNVTTNILQTCEKTNPDIVVQSDNSTNSFVNGGNLEELLQDIATISDDILQISSNQNPVIPDIPDKPYKSEINVVLMPKPMPLIGFEKYQTIKTSLESLEAIQKSNESLEQTAELPNDPVPVAEVPACFTPQPVFPTPEEYTPHPKLTRQPSNPFFYGSFDSYRYNPNNYCNLNQSHDNFAFKNDASSTEKLDKIIEDVTPPEDEETKVKLDNSDKELTENDSNLNKTDETNNKSIKNRRTRKVSIYFKGKKDKIARSLSLDTAKSENDKKQKQSLFEPELNESLEKKDSDNQKSSDSKASYDRKHRKSSSTSPERKHVQISDAPQSGASKKCHKRRHKKSERRANLNRRSSISIDKFNRDQRSFSVCTDRSNILDHKFGNHSDEFFTNSERDRSNSLSSCETIKSRKLSQIPQFQVAGKIPWFGCWGNGCL